MSAGRELLRGGVRLGLLLALGLAGAGCHSVTPDAQRQAPAEVVLGARVLVAQPVLRLGEAESQKNYAIGEVQAPAQLQRELVKWLDVAAVSSVVRAAQAPDSASAIREAWKAGDDLLLELDLSLSTTYLGHNGWYIPNIGLWIMWLVPSWFVATEEYSLNLSGEVSLRSVDSGRVVHVRPLEVEVEGTFGEFDRGWQPFGFIYPSNDEDNWRQITGRLLGPARTYLNAEVARVLRDYAATAGEQLQGDTSKSLVLSLGVQDYADAIKHPPLPYAARDANAVATALAAAMGLEDRHIFRPRGSLRELKEALGELERRLRAGDRLVIYLAGYGRRDAEGRPRFLLRDAGQDADSDLDLVALAERLGQLPGQKWLIVDASFDGGGRSVGTKGGGAAAQDAGALGAALGGPVLLAAGGGERLLTPEHLEGSLFAHHLRGALSARADADGDGTLRVHEVSTLVRMATEADAAHFGAQQRPRAAGADHDFGLCELRAAKAKEEVK